MLFRCVLLLAAASVCSLALARAPAPVIVKTLSEEPFAPTIEALGTLRANEAVTLSATVTETIRAIHFEDGQRVQAGDVLVEMTSGEQHALLAEAQSQLDEARRQFERVESLVATNLANESLLDQRRQAYHSAKARLEATQSRLADRLIVAPFDGVVGLRNISVGTLVRPGDTITTLDDDRVMKLDFSVPAVFLQTVRPGAQVTAHSPELRGVEITSEVTSVSSRIDPLTRSVTARAILPNDDFQLRPGMLMTVQLQSNPTPSLMLPEEALIQEGFRSFVFRVNREGETPTVTKQEVTTGGRRLGEVVISEGLEVGDTVVTHGVMRLNDGSRIRITAEQQGGETLSQLLSGSPVASDAHGTGE